MEEKIIWKTIKLKKKVELKAGEHYGIHTDGEKVLIKKIVGFDELDHPIFGETIYEDCSGE